MPDPRDVLVIGALGLGMIGVGVAFIWAGVKGQSIRAFFEGMKPTGGRSGVTLSELPQSDPAVNPAAQGPPNPYIINNPRGVISP